MLGIIYLLLCALFGICFVGLAVPDVRRLYMACSSSAKAISHIPNTLFTVPAGIVTGMLCVPFFNYYVTLGLSYVIDNGDLCKKLGVLITFAFFIWMILTCLILINRKRIKREKAKEEGSTSIDDYKNNILDTVFYGAVILVITVATTFLMFYTYRISGTTLVNGASTFSDLSPHTAMVSSFGTGFNFPTQYMHFSGDGIKYHFLFYFFAGTLEYLGLPIDYALNIPSIASMVCALVLLGLLAMFISSKRASFLLAPVLVFFRSSLNIFYHFGELLSAGNTPVQALKEIAGSNIWYAVTDYDNWGIWAINVYPNQRHLMLGISVILIMVILFLPFVRRLCISVSRAGSFVDGLKAIAFSGNAWLPRSGDPLSPLSISLLACILVIVMPYFHGSCLIALLLVLFGMAIFSESRLCYLAVAICGVVSSYIQTLVFSGGYKNVVSFEFKPGFILNELTASSVARYLLIVTGGTLVLAFVFALIALVMDIIRKKPVHRILLLICFLNPMIFAFLCQVSLEMLANHKFIQVSLILVDVFVAALISNLLFIPVKLRKTSANAEAVSASETTGAEVIAVETVSAVTADNARPALPASPFGEYSEDDGESDTLDVDPEEETLPEALPEETVNKEPLFGDEATAEDVTDGSEEEESEITSEEDSETASDETNDSDAESSADSDSNAGVEEDSSSNTDTSENFAAIATLFSERIKEVQSENNASDDAAAEETPADIIEETIVETTEETAVTESAAVSDTVTSDESENDEDFDDSDDSDVALMESTEQPAHAEMRPGSMALGLTFGEEEPVIEEDPNIIIESADEAVSVAVIDASDDDTKSETDSEFAPESLKHEAIVPAKAKGLSLPAWIALEIAGVLLAIALMLPLTATGLSEWATYININKHPVLVNTDSAVTEWIVENTEPSDVFLTPTWSMNRFILAGRPMYYGHAYYAWSAGHDTYTRDTIYQWLISGCGGDINEFTRYCKERNIRYLIVDSDFDGVTFESGVTFNREFFEQNLTQAAYFAEENTTIYRIF